MTATCMIYDQRLKGELQSLRRKGALFVGGQQQTEASSGVLVGSRSCSRCRGELGRIINRGATCPLCNQRVCKNCRQYGDSPTQWLCIVCHKHMELKNASGEWMSDWVNKQQGKIISPAETVKRSIQRSWTFSDVSPSPWSYLRGSPEMRAYSSMPRHQDIEYIRPPPSFTKSKDKITATVCFADSNNFNSRTSSVNQESVTTTHSSPTTTVEASSCCSGETPGSEQILQFALGVKDESVPTDTEVPCVESSPTVEKREVVESLTGAIFRKVTLRVDARNLPPGVTPPRSRRNILSSSETHEEFLGEMMGSYADHRALAPDSDDYKLVFISSSDSSSREELHSDDNSSVSSCAAAGLLEDCDWDYFECWPSSVSRREAPPEGSTASIGVVDRAKQTESDSTDSCRVNLGQYVAIHVPIPVPFPFPVPVFVPVPVPAGAAMSSSCETNSRLPDSEVLPIEEIISKNAVSPVLVCADPEENNSVVLKVYKSLGTTDNVISPSSEDILRLTEARLKDFTDFRDDNSLSSISSTEDGEPSVRVYNLNDSDGSSSDFSLAASPPKSLTASATSSSSSDEEECEQNDTNKKGRKNFKRTFVLYESSGSESASSDENSEITQINNENSSIQETKKKAPLDMCNETPDNEIERRPEKSDSSLFIISDDSSHGNRKANDFDSLSDTCEFALNIKNKSEPISSHLTCSDSELISGSPGDKMTENTLEENTSRSSDVINSIIKFSHEELLQTVSEFLEEERKFLCASVKMESSVTEVDGALPETRSNTSDEFSGTESMEMPLEDSLEYKKGCGEGGHFRGTVATSESGTSSSARYTSLVMITQEAGASSVPPAASKLQPPADTPATEVAGSNSTTTGVCLEEGLADDDSWVEELDREEALTTTEESSEDEPYPDREEELRGYHRSAIDFTLHTIAEESCEESEMEGEKNRPTELEKYFFYGLGDSANNNEDKEDTMSETSSIYSEGVESIVSASGVEEASTSVDPAEMASSRLEKYFLSGFMGFNRRDSDGSVGSDSEGRPSPEQRRKRLVRARGTGRQHSNSLDNLVESTEQTEPQVETEGSSTETDSHDEQLASSFDKGDGQFDTVKRTKKKKRSVPSTPSDLLEVPENYLGSCEEKSADDGKKTPQPDLQQSDLLNSRNKQQSRDSGFVGSCDDLLKESKDNIEASNTEESPALTDLKNNNYSETSQAPIPAAALIRKDSFNNWSSDEETNLMMSKMRAFFKTMVGTQPKGPNVKPKTKPPQLVYFENELTMLMKTVPGIRDEQVKEIVEYLSSEDTWSDSYDSSDYTSSDLENSSKRSALQEEISASCRQIISNFETSANDDLSPSPEVGKDSAFVYQRLVASFSKMEVPKNDNVQNSPLLIEKVMQHIGSRLWALMHEVSGGESSSPKSGRYHKRLSSKLSASTTEEEEDCVEGYSPLPRSKSHDPLLEETRQEASDNERFSWRGSFESALMASDSRTRLASGGESSASASALALAAKRRSAGDLMFKSCSREQLDRVRSCGSIGGSIEDKIWTREQKRRRNSIPDSGGSDGDDDSDVDEASAGSRATLPRSLQSSCASATNSLPRLPTTPSPTSSTPIYKSHSVHQFNAKSARYRPPGYRNSPLAPPPRRERNRRSHGNSSINGCDDSSICSEPSAKGPEEEVDRLLNPRTSLGARSDSLASVYSGAGEGRHGGVAVKGDVQFGLQYNYKQSCLEIHVKQCKDLAPVDTKRNRSDPYVKVYLLPDKSKSGKRKTRVKKHTLNPVFDEVLRFQVSLDGLETRTLWLSVWHSDMFGRNDFLGEVLMPLENKVFDDPLPKFYTLQERSEPLEELNSKGELIVGLKYETPDESSNKKKPSKGCLYVLIKEAKNLPPVKSNGTSDPFCKSYLLPDKGKGSKQKAPVVKRTCSPAWNHTFTYNNISLEELTERSLELTIWDHDRLASNEFLGGVRLNVGSGRYQGRVVDWMDSSGNEMALWQRMIEKPNFWVESCLALRPSLDLRRSLDL